MHILVATSDIARRAIQEVGVHVGRAQDVREQMGTESRKVADLRQRIMADLDRARGKHKRTLRSRLGRLDRWADDHYRDSSKDLEKNWASTSEKLQKKIDDVVEQDWDSLQVRLAKSRRRSMRPGARSPFRQEVPRAHARRCRSIYRVVGPRREGECLARRRRDRLLPRRATWRTHRRRDR